MMMMIMIEYSLSESTLDSQEFDCSVSKRCSLRGFTVYILCYIKT